MFASRASFALLSALVLGGCDTLGPDSGESPALPAVNSDKLRHWDLFESDPSSAAIGDSVGLIVTFGGGVTDPEEASDSVFHGQEVRRRTYYRDSFTGVSVLVALSDLVPVLGAVTASPLVAFVEPDLNIEQAVILPTFLDEVLLRVTYGLSEWLLLQLRPWSVRHVGGHESWTVSGDGGGVVDADVYVIDGPIAHPDLNVVERVSFIDDDAPAADAHHGTHIAGIIGAVDDPNGVVGIAPGARIHSLEVLAAGGSTTMSALVDAIEFVIQRKRDDPSRPMVVNMSIGRDIRTTRLNALDHAVAEAVESGIVVVVSAGNDAANAASFSPAHAPGVITVGATDRSDEFASGFSNGGSVVDVLAPGEDVLSLGGRGLWASMSGTSMAAAHVSGAAALYLARNPSAPPVQVLDYISRRSENATGMPSGTTGRRVDVRDL